MKLTKLTSDIWREKNNQSDDLLTQVKFKLETLSDHDLKVVDQSLRDFQQEYSSELSIESYLCALALVDNKLDNIVNYPVYLRNEYIDNAAKTSNCSSDTIVKLISYFSRIK